MRVRELGTAGAAYLAASAANVVLGLVAADLWEQWGGQVDRRMLIEVSWGVTVGVPSLFAARDLTLKALGRKETPPWAKASFLPVWGGAAGVRVTLTRAVKSIFKQSSNEFDLPMTYIFHSVDSNGKRHTLTDEEVRGALRSAWSHRRKYPWSRRRIMVGVGMRREEYDALMNLLMSVPGIVYDRDGDNRSGKIKLPPLLAAELVQEMRGQLLMG